MRRRRLAFPTGKVARPLAVTDESQNAAYFLQPNWNGSIVHLTAHKQSRFQLTRLAARATLPAREGKCALRAQDAHLYKSQFAEASLVEGPKGCNGMYHVRNALGAGPACSRGPMAAEHVAQHPQRTGRGPCPLPFHQLSIGNLHGLSQFGKPAGLAAGDEDLAAFDLVEHKVLPFFVQLGEHIVQ